MEAILLVPIGILLFSGAGLLGAISFNKIKSTPFRIWLGVGLMILGIIINVVMAHMMIGTI